MLSPASPFTAPREKCVHYRDGMLDMRQANTKPRRPTIGEMREEARWRRTTQEVQFRVGWDKWHTVFRIQPTSIGVAGAGVGLFAAREYNTGDNLAVYMGQDVGSARDPPCVDTVAGQSEHVMAVKGRLIDGLHGASGAQFINAAYHLHTGQRNNAKFCNTGTIKATKIIKVGQEILMAYGVHMWAGLSRAKRWTEAHPDAARTLAEQAADRHCPIAHHDGEAPKQRRAPARAVGDQSGRVGSGVC